MRRWGLLLALIAACGGTRDGAGPGVGAAAGDLAEREPIATYADPDRGRLRLRVEPPDAEVRVNGVTRGLASDFAAPGYLLLDPGPQRIEIAKEGYATHRVEIVVSAEVLETLPVRLRPLSGGRGRR